MTTISAWNGWDPLVEVWLGDCWPPEFFEHLESPIRDNFQKIADMTREDLKKIQEFLESRGVTVRRPVIEPDYNRYTFYDGVLIKPPICPRDYTATIGETLYFSDEPYYFLNAKKVPSTWQYWVDEYRRQGQRVATTREPISTAHIIRLGKDLIWDDCYPRAYFDGRMARREKLETRYYKRKVFEERVTDVFTDNFRVHYTNNGGHADGCLSVLRPGLVLGTDYWPAYDQTFPGWEKIMIRNKPEWNDHTWGNYFLDGAGFKWFVPDELNGIGGMHFNRYIEKYASDWIGNYKETYFEVNILILDSKNIMCIGEHPALFEELDKHGINCHVVPFRTRSFWDGGLHCITSDISRLGSCQDYWPERGTPGLGLNIDSDRFAE
jgi:N-dimethylarginine dimethylaminohydrolase